MSGIETTDLFDLSHTAAEDYLASFHFPWQALDGIGEMIRSLGRAMSEKEYLQSSSQVWVHRTACVAPGATLCAPCIIGAHSEVRPGAYIRGAALIGEGCVIGNSTEIKNAILFDCVQVPHYNYVGDSILGHGVHLGAGVITSNVKSDRSLVVIHGGTDSIFTGRRKVGAMLGDGVEVGCNSVLNPGTVIGRGSRVYPLSSVRGVIRAGCIYKADGTIAMME